jgi:glucose/arabinose dehydrogenase
MSSTCRIAAVLAAVPIIVAAQGGASTTVTSSSGPIKVEQLATLEFPWGMAALPDGRILITEKPGRLRIYQNGSLSAPIEGVPKTTYRERKQEQGGLLDVAVDPQFAENRHIYLAYSEAAPKQSADQKETDDPRFGGGLDLTDNLLAGGAVARATLDGNRLTDLQVIWRQEPKTIGRGHFGHRLNFGPDGAMFITSGDRMRFDPAQDKIANLGKVVRIKDGKAENWSIGHRNMLAAAINPHSGLLWVWEMGPLGGDELNVIEQGQNYGWPVVSDGDNYDKSSIPEVRAPIKTWTPVISPSGALFYSGSLFPWKGDAIVGGLSSQAIIRLTVDGASVKSEERLDMKRRIRDVMQAEDGAILAISDETNGALLRLTPGGSTVR